MASKFKRNKAPGWSSSDEEEGEATSSDEDDHDTYKRSRTNDQKPTGPVANAGAKISHNDQNSTGKKVNTIWSDVLVDQQLSGGLSHGVNVMSGDTFVPRGSETYDCTKAKEAAKANEEAKPVKSESMEELVDKGNESDDDPFGDVHTEGPDMMASLADKPKFHGNSDRGNRKRPWPRGGSRRQVEERRNSNQSTDSSAQDGDRGSRGRGQWNGPRGRGRGQFGGDRSRSGGRRRLEKISLNKEESPKEIALAIARSLHEVKTDLMTRAVVCVGAEKAIALYYRTVEVENSGGLMTLDGRRRRTSGGVFLHLLREDAEIPEAQKTELFGADREEYRQQLMAKRRLQKKLEEGETSKMEVNDSEKPLKDLKDVFLQEALKGPKTDQGGASTEEIPMDG